MGVRKCVVSFEDGRGCRHSTEVLAASVLEAAAMGVRAIRDQGVSNDDATFDIRVEVQTTTFHQVSWTKLQQWLTSNAADPKEQAAKARVR